MTEPTVSEAPLIERRAFPFMQVELRSTRGGSPRMVGHAAVFNSLSEPLAQLGGAREVIRPGAFAKTIKEQDVYALFNHDENMPLARSGNGSLFLSEDKRGLSTEISPTDTTYSRDLMTNMREGLITKMSFSFGTVKDEWRGARGSANAVRELQEVRLFDVSPVTFPAYPATDIQARSILTSAGMEFDELSSVLFKRRHGVPMTVADRDLVKRSISLLRGFLAPEPGRTTHSDMTEPLSGVALMRKRLEQAAQI